jgi:hypothetical protein
VTGRFDFEGRGFTCEIATIVKLAAAITAVEETSAGQTLQQIEKPDIHGIDPVPCLQFDDAVGSAGRATGMWIKVKTVAAGDEFFRFAVFAGINRHVAETLEESPVDTVQLSAALATLVHSLCCL